MLETIIMVLVVLWLLGYFGGGRLGWGRRGNLVYAPLVLALIVPVVRLLSQRVRSSR